MYRVKTLKKSRSKSSVSIDITDACWKVIKYLSSTFFSGNSCFFSLNKMAINL